MTTTYLALTFTESVRRTQSAYYGQAFKIGDVPASDSLGAAETEFIAARDSFYLGTVSENGWPYIQHRGGPAGFLRVLNSTTLAFADYRGNRQLLTTGNLSFNDRVALFLMNYPKRERLKLLGHARVEDARAHPELVAQMPDPSMTARVERVVFIDVVSFDWNCTKHITPRYTPAEIEELAGPLRARIDELEAELRAVKAGATLVREHARASK